MKKIVSCCLLILLSACEVGPDYHMPDIKLPSGWFYASDKTKPDEKAAIEQEWWRHFNDPVLNQLIDKALASNFDLKMAEARIGQARADMSASQTGLLPTGGVMADDEREANRIAFPGPLNLTVPFSIYQTGFDATWELDLFGAKRRDIESKEATLLASEAERDDAEVSLLAEVARTYVLIRQYQEELVIAKDTVTADKKTLDIVKQRFNVGQSPGFDVVRAKAQAEQAEEDVPQLENTLSQTEIAMDVLLGEQPGATHALVQDKKPMPLFDGSFIMAAPAAIIANRPDIRVAEKKLASATAEQGVAVAKFFPDVSLSGFFGLLNVDRSNLLLGKSKAWDYEGNVMLPILNYGTLSANLDAANAEQQEALASYRKTIIAALADVERAVSAYEHQDAYQTAVEKTTADNREASKIASMRYKDGLSSFVDVLDADRTLYTSETQLAEARAQDAENIIALYKSFGGGWKIDSGSEKNSKKNRSRQTYRQFCGHNIAETL